MILSDRGLAQAFSPDAVSAHTDSVPNAANR